MTEVCVSGDVEGGGVLAGLSSEVEPEVVEYAIDGAVAAGVQVVQRGAASVWQLYVVSDWVKSCGGK